MADIITTADALEMYLNEGFDNVMPFTSDYERDFLEYLGDRGIVVIDDTGEDLDGQQGCNQILQ